MSNETPKTLGLITINYVVMSILNRLRDYSQRNYSFIQQLVIEGYTELSLWHLNNIEVVYLRMSDAKTVDLPDDFVDYVKIGIPEQGRIKVLTRDNSILFPRKFEDGADVGNTDDPDAPVGAVYFVDHFRGGQFVGGLYGLPGGIDQAYYRIDKERKQIIFSGSVTRSEIVLEYISSGVNLQGTTVIPREAVPALRQYVLWQMIENDPKAPANEKERKKYQFEEQVEALRSFQNTITADEYKRMVYRSSKQTIKR